MTSGSTDILTWDLSNGSTARAPIGWPPGPAPDSAIPSTGWTSFSWPIYGAVQLEHLAGPLRKNVYGEYPSRSASVEAGNRYQGGLPAEPFSGGAPSGWKPEKVTKALAGRLRAGGEGEADLFQVGIMNALSRPPCGGRRDGSTEWTGE